MAWKTGIQEYISHVTICNSSRPDHISHPDNIFSDLLQHRHSHLQRLLDVGLHNSLHHVSCLLYRLRLGCWLRQSKRLPPTLSIPTKRTLAEHQNLLDLGMAKYLPRFNHNVLVLHSFWKHLHRYRYDNIHLTDHYLATEHLHDTHEDRKDSSDQPDPDIRHLHWVHHTLPGIYRCFNYRFQLC